MSQTSKNAAYPIVKPDTGVTRQVLSETAEMMTVIFRFEKDAVGALHSHPHVQSTYVSSGKFLFHIDGQDFELNPGDSMIIPGNAVHGCQCQEAGDLIDTFTPRRDDFL
jgi:quercetin dioxygenase-like cupin family protein